MTPLHTVVSIDDHEIVHQGVEHLCERIAAWHFAGSATTAEGAIGLVRATVPSVIIIDLLLGTEQSWGLSEVLLQEAPEAKLIYYSAFGSGASVETALRLGASAYILKSGSADVLASAVERVLQGEIVIDPALTQKWMEHRRSANALNLDKRQLRILELIAAGKDNYEIAEELYISYHTVKFHISKMLKASGEVNRAGLVRLAKEQFLIP